MADRFQNGLLLEAITASQGGRTFQRWLVEFATQICGWTLQEEQAGTRYTNTKATGINGASVVSEPQRLDITGDGYTFTAADEGRYLTITNMPVGFEDRNGIYRIAKFLTSKIVNLDIRFSVHDAGIPHPSTGLTWRLWSNDASDVPAYAGTDYAVIRGTGTQGGAYNFDVKITSQATDAGFPQFEVGPFGTWTPGAPGSWSDARNTSAFEQWLNNSQDNMRVYAAGDADRIVVAIRNFDNNQHWHFLYIGEMDAFYSNAIDPNPVVVWHGHNSTSDLDTLFGRGLSAATSIYWGGRGLAEDDLTTLTYYATFFQVSPVGNVNWFMGRQSRMSSRTSRFYRQGWMVESRTASHMEHRGTLRRCWIGVRANDRGIVFGRNGEFLHIVGGLILPWNGSGQHEQRT